MNKTVFLLLTLFLFGLGVASSKYMPIVTVKKCTGCTECDAACPFEAITMVGDKAVINPEKCTGCMACVKICSWGAVK